MDFTFIDSGIGGIPYMMRLLDMDKSRSCVYLADTAAFPYGNKTQSEVIERAVFAVGSAIKTWQPRVIVIACNTMSVAALGTLRKTFDTPIVGTVPAIRLAAQTTKNLRIGFLATDATAASSYSKELAAHYAASCTMFPLGAPALVSFVENRITEASEQEKEEAVKEAAAYFAERDCDTIILGCTHFTHLYAQMKKVAASLIPGCEIVDSRDGVAKQSLKVLAASRYGASSNAPERDNRCVFVTGEERATWKKLCAMYALNWKGHLIS